MRFFVFALTALLLNTILFKADDASAETITIVADSWCPYNCEPNSDHPGLMIEIAKKAFAKHNINVEYSLLPWTRAIEETRQSKYTAIVGASHKDAPDFIFPTVSQGMMRNGFYVKKGNKWRFTDMKSLDDISLGAIADYSYNEELDQYIINHKKDHRRIQVISGDNALDINFKKLKAGRIGALIEGQYVADHYTGKNKMSEEFELAGYLPASENDNLFVAFSPNEPKAKFYADILAKETEEIRANGELKQILDAYNVSDWKK